jgi:hypothetical protein
MGFAENFIQAFVQGSQIRQRQEQLAQQAEASKLEREVLQQRIRQLKLEENLKTWDLKDRQHAILSGRPQSSYSQQQAPGESERLGLESLIGGVQTAVPGASPISNQLTDPWGDTVAGYEGDQQMPSFPAAGLARQQTVMPQTDYPAIPELGVGGMSRPAESMEEMLFKMRAEAEAKMSGMNMMPFQAIPGQTPTGDDALFSFDKRSGTATPVQGVTPRAQRTPSAGVVLNGAAQLAGYDSFDQVPESERGQVYQLAAQMTQELSRNRRLGTGQGALESPITPTVSAQTGLPVGQPGSASTGQVIKTQEQRQQERTGEILLGDMKVLMGDGQKPGLIDILPSKSEWAGTAPNATMAIRERSNEYREQVAQLRSVVESMVNDLARYRGQRGAQTEGDVNRAYSALVALQSGLTTALTDPFGGDTRESARARLIQAQDGLKRVAAVLNKVNTTSTNTAPGAAGTVQAPASGKFYKDANGRWVFGTPQ